MRWTWGVLCLAGSLAGCTSDVDKTETSESESDSVVESESEEATDTEVIDDAWSWCPDAPPADPAEGRRWVVGSRARYCATFNRFRELRDEPAAEAVLYMPSTVVQLDGGDMFDVPFTACVEEEEGQVGLVPSGDASVRMADTPRNWVAGMEITLVDPDGGEWLLSVSSRRGLDDDVADLNGQHLPLTDPNAVTITLCEQPCADPSQTRLFDSCDFAGTPIYRNNVSFTGGEIELDVAISEALFDTQPGLFVRASGELEGTAFSQDGYYDLIYNPILHHISRDAIVRLPEAIGGVAAIEVRDFDANQEDPPTRVFLLDEALVEVEEREVTGESDVLLRGD